MSEIKHNREEIEKIIDKMKMTKEKGEKLEVTLFEISTTIQSSFSGKSKENLVSLIEIRVQKLKKEIENWKTLIEQAINLANSLEEQDESLGDDFQSNTQIFA